MSFTLHQQAFNAPVAAGTSAVVTLTGVSAGDLITVQAAVNANLALTVKDNVNTGNYTGSNAQFFDTTNAWRQGMFHFIASKSGTLVITATWDGTSQFLCIFAQAWTPSGGVAVQDTTMTEIAGIVTGANPNAGSALTPAIDNEIVLGFLQTSSGSLPTAGTNYALPTGIAVQYGLYPEWSIQTTKTATNAPFTLASATNTDQMVAFKISPVIVAVTDDSAEQFDVAANFAVLFDEVQLFDDRGIVIGNKGLPRAPFAFVDESAENKTDSHGKGGKMTPDWFSQYESGDIDSRGVELGMAGLPRVPVAYVDDGENKFDSTAMNRAALSDRTSESDEPGTLGPVPIATQEEDQELELFVPFQFQLEDLESDLAIVPPPAIAGITLNAHNQNDPFPATATSASVTLTGVKLGDLIVVEVAIANNVAITVTDDTNVGNYSPGISQYFYAPNSDTGGIFYFQNSKPGTITITANWVGSANQGFAIFAQSWSGAATGAGVEDVTMTSQQGTTTSANPSAAASPLTPIMDGELVISFMINSSGTIPTAGSGFTNLNPSVVGAQCYPEYSIQTARAATTGPWTLASAQWNCQMVAFKPLIVSVGGEDESHQFEVSVNFSVLFTEGEENDFLVTPPPVVANVGLDDIESIFKFVETLALYDHTADMDEPGSVPAPPFAIQDGETEKTYDQRSVYDPTPETDEPGGLQPPPPVFSDNEDLQRWVATSSSALEDDQSDKLQSPPQVIPDDADAQKWGATLSVQHDDTDTNQTIPPPPPIFDDPEIARWVGTLAVQHDDTETQRTSTPQPPNADDSEVSKWVGASAIQEDDTDKNLVVPPLPPETEPETAEDFEAQSMTAPLVRELQGEDVEVTVPARPPTVFTDNEDLQKWIGYAAPALEDDQSNLLQTPPQVIPDDADSQKWGATLAVQHDDTDTNQSIPPPPPSSLQDGEIEKTYDQRTVYDHIAETDEPGGLQPPPVVFTDNEDLQKWIGWAAPALEDDQSNRLQSPPSAITDDAESLLWAGTTQVYHEDAETQRAFPPPPPFSFEEEYKFLSGVIMYFPVENDDNYRFVTPPVVAPNMGMDDIETMVHSQDQVIQFFEDVEQTKTPRPPAAPVDESEQANNFGWKAAFEPDLELHRSFPPPPPKVLQDEISEAWKAWSQLYHDDLETQQTIPPPPPSVLQDEVSEEWRDVLQVWHDDTETQRALPPKPPLADDSEMSEWTGTSSFQLDDEAVAKTPPPPIPKTGYDEIESMARANDAVAFQPEELIVELPPKPPTVQRDEAEDSQWVDQRFVQHDDTETQNSLPPTPPAVPPKSIAEEILEQWFGQMQVYHDDAETQRALPPPPPFSYEEEYKFLAGQRATFYLDDSEGTAISPASLFRFIELLLANFLVLPTFDFSEGVEAFVAVWTRTETFAYDNPTLSSDMMPAPTEVEPVLSFSGFQALGVMSLNSFIADKVFDGSGFDRPGVPQ